MHQRASPFPLLFVPFNIGGVISLQDCSLPPQAQLSSLHTNLLSKHLHKQNRKLPHFLVTLDLDKLLSILLLTGCQFDEEVPGASRGTQLGVSVKRGGKTHSGCGQHCSTRARVLH